MSAITFHKPEKVVMQKASDFEGIFEFAPLEKGFGVTIGNSLRRVLLSSLDGYAITTLKIQGVTNEFSTIPGVYEDVTDIVLNLKQIRFKPLGIENEEKVFLSVGGKEVFTGADISKASSYFQVLNPEQLICNMEPSVRLEVEITISHGKGYSPAENNLANDANVGVIPIDAIYSPIKLVKYTTENTRVGQDTDFEKLIIELKTDGSVHPEDALKKAAKIMIQHMMLFSDENITLDNESKKEDDQVDEKFLHMRKLLKTPLSDLDLSVRAFNCLRAAEIKTLGDLVHFDIADLLKFRNFGKKSLAELEELVRDKNLTFGLDVTKYRLDEE